MSGHESGGSGKRSSGSSDNLSTPLIQSSASLDRSAELTSVISASSTFTGWHEVDATTCQEIALLWALAWPLFFQTLANEIQMVVTTSLFGHMGETDLAAANDTTSMIWFILVFVMGAQNALYTMAPQAVGAGSRRQVGIVLQVTLFWTVVVLGPITTVCCYFMGDGLVALGLTNTTDPVETASVQSFSHASAWWMMPYIVVTTVTTWLDAISVVQAPSFISAIFAVSGVGLAWLLMYEGFELSSDLAPSESGGEDGEKFSIGFPALGLNGFAYASAITYTCQFVVLYLYVFWYRGQHKHVWFGWQPTRVFHCKLMQRFIMLSLPMMLQYALNSWTSTIFQLFMSWNSELFAAAYGVTSTYVSTGGSVSNALFMAVSTRVGNCLGEGDPVRAKKASIVGFFFAAGAGSIISTAIFAFRAPLAHFYTPDDPIAELAIDAAPFVVGYYFMNSCVWGLWAVMQGQMRTCYPATVICVGMWCISVPLGYVVVTYNWSEHLNMNPLTALWACCVVGETVTFLLMAGAIVLSDWEAIAKEAIESSRLGEDNEEEDYDALDKEILGEKPTAIQ